MRYVCNLSTDAAFNMAFDEFMLEQLPLDEPVFCLWQNAPAVIVGLNQNVYTEVNLPYLRAHDIQLARRVTGGGAVYHDLQNLNYTIAGRATNLEADYPYYMQLMVKALRSLGVPAEQNGRNDILVKGQKVSGYAKRVWKDRIMIHGTLLYDVDLNALSQVLSVPGSKFSVPSGGSRHAGGIPSVHARVTNLRDYLPNIRNVHQLQEELTRILSNEHTDKELPLQKDHLRQVGQLANEKFRKWEWIYGRSPQANLSRSRRFSCGTVEVFLTIGHGIIQAISFAGDFIGNTPADELAAQIAGVRFKKEEVLQRLAELNVQSYFDHLSPDELAALIAD